MPETIAQSRRSILRWIGAAAFSSVLGESTAHAELSPPLPGLSYLGIDAFAFWPEGDGRRIYQDLTGTVPSNSPARISAPLFLPAGSSILQISASYIGQPIISISRRRLATPTPLTDVYLKALPAGLNPFESTDNLATPIKIDTDSTYAVRVFTSVGQSIFGVQVGYVPPAAGFVPNTAANKRLLDTVRSGGPLLVGNARQIASRSLGNKFAVINVTTSQATNNGFLSCYAGSAINHLPVVSYRNGGNSGNLVIAPLTGTGTFKLLAHGSKTHATVDLVGFLR